MSSRALATSIALVVVGAAIAVGCGGDDSTTSEALSKSEFLKQGNAICKQGNQDINAAFKDALGGGGKPSQDELDQVVTDSVVPSIQGQIDDLSALTPPTGDEDTVNNILDEAQTALDQVKDDPSAITGKDDPFAQANQDAKAYGLTVCGSG
jgi:hypothetical protein